MLPKPMSSTTIQAISRLMGMTAVNVLKNFAIAWLKGKLIDEPAFEKQFQHIIIPEIAEKLKGWKLQVASHQAGGDAVYANVTVEIGVIRPLKRNVSPFEISPPLIELKSVIVSTDN